MCRPGQSNRGDASPFPLPFSKATAIRGLVAASLLTALLSLACAHAEPTAPPAPNPDGDIIYEPGNMPVILLAPHDGTLIPDGSPLRPTNAGRDVNTSKLARELAEALEYRDATGAKRRPYVVINQLHRKVMEPNRSWEDNLDSEWLNDDGGKAGGPVPRATRAFEDYHACADHAVKEVQAAFGTGFLVDLHGLGSSRSADMYGYLLRPSHLADPKDHDAATSDDALAEAIRQRSTLKTAAARKGDAAAAIAGLVRGPESLASLMNAALEANREAPRPAVPSAQFPNPKASSTPDHDQIYFNGAYDIAAHSSYRVGTAVDAVQIETLATARNTEKQRQVFAEAMAEALRNFLELHYGLDIRGK